MPTLMSVGALWLCAVVCAKPASGMEAMNNLLTHMNTMNLRFVIVDSPVRGFAEKWRLP